jgi:hypothetical protein
VTYPVILFDSLGVVSSSLKFDFPYLFKGQVDFLRTLRGFIILRLEILAILDKVVVVLVVVSYVQCFITILVCQLLIGLDAIFDFF